MERGRNDSGRYNDRIEPDSVLEVFDEREDQAEPLTASDIVDRMDIARRTAHNKLNALTERGVLETKKVGARGRIWWVPDNGQQNGHSRPSEQSGAGEGSSSTDRTDGSSERERVESILRDLDLPGSGEKLEKRREAVKASYEYLKEQGEAKAGDFQNDVYPDYPAGYTNGKNPAYSWWTNCVYKGMKQVATFDDRVKVPDTREPWRYE